jgi:small-conductance mechanosensitive channel
LARPEAMLEEQSCRRTGVSSESLEINGFYGMLVRMKSLAKNLADAKRRNSSYLLMAFLFACILPAPLALAQQQAEPGGAVDEESGVPPAPQPIPLAHISSQSEQVAIRLRAMRIHSEPNLDVEAIKQQIPAAVEKYEKLKSLTDKQLSGGISARHLEDLQRRWNRAERRINGWRSHLNQRSNILERDMETLLELRLSWDATLASAAALDAQDAVLVVIQNTLESVVTHSERVGKRRAELLDVQGQVFRIVELIEDARDLVHSAETRLVERLTEFDSPPLWKTMFHPAQTQSVGAQLRGVRQQNFADLREFFTLRRNWLIAFGLFFVAGIAALVILNRRLQRLQSDLPDQEAAARILSRPVSSSLMVTLVLLVVNFPNAPRIVNEIASIVIIFPLIRLFPGRVFANTRMILIAIIALHILSRFIDLLPTISLMRRLLYLGITVIAFTVAYRGLQKASEVSAKVSLWQRFIRISLKIYLPLLGIALVANILGNVSLSDVIVSAAIRSAYVALVLYTFYLIVESVLSISMGASAIRKIRMVRRHEVLVRTRLLAVFRLAIFAFWLGWSLQFLRIFNLIVDGLRALLTAEAKFGEVGISLGGFLGFAVTVWVAFTLSRLIRFILDEDVYPRLTLPRGVPNAISTGLHYVILLMGFFLALAATGADLSKFAILAGAFGVGIGFGLQNVVNNFISGLILIAERPIMAGDTIEVNNMIGQVKRIGMRSSTIRTWKGAEVIVPNGNLISNDVINWTLSDPQRRIDVPVGVAYGSDVDKVIDVLKSAAASHPDLLDNPAPNALFMRFGDSSLDFELRVWTTKFEGYQRVHSDVVVAVEKALSEAGIVIPFPQRDLHVKSVDSDAGKTLRGDDSLES